MEKIFLLGATGPIGQEFVSRLQQDSFFKEGYPDVDWRTAGDVQKRAILNDCAAVILAVPRKFSLEIAEEIKSIRAGITIYDCSGMHRGQEGWEYALPELNSRIGNGINRFVGPGCFATAASLALFPIRTEITGPIFIGAVGGASTGGKKWVTYFENNPHQDIVLPNQGFNHPHISEIKANLNLPEADIRMVPHLARRYRGSTMAIHGRLNDPTEIKYNERLGSWDRVIYSPNVPNWIDVVMTDHVHVHWAQDGSQFTIYVAYDNLGKGSVGQALQTLNTSLL